MTPLLVGGIISSLVGLVMYVVGIATPAWVTYSSLGLRQEWGLWQVCTTYIRYRTCEVYQATSQGSFHATRAFAVIGPLLLVSGVALVYYAEHKNSNKDKRKYGVLIIAGGVCGVIAAAIFGVGMRNAIVADLSVPPYGYSFYLTWVQALLTGGGGAIIVAAGRRVTEYEQVVHREVLIAMRESVI